MFSYLKTGERLQCRRCGSQAWCIDTVDGLRIGCSQCGKVIAGDHAESMCVEQKRYIEAGRYRKLVNQTGSSDGIPIPESVTEYREQLMPGDREAYPLRVLPEPNWPFHYSAGPS